jgi:hypothetical protein
MNKEISPVQSFYKNIEEKQRIAKERQEMLDSLSPEEKRALLKSERKRGRPQKRYYFTMDTQDAIVAYNHETDDKLRNKVFNEYIYKALIKLAENIIHTFRLYYFNATSKQLQHEVVAFLLEKMPKFTPEKGKAFSYFSIVAKHYLIINNNKNYKRMIGKKPVDNIDTQRDLTNESVRNDLLEEHRDFMDIFTSYWEINMYNAYSKKRDIRIVDAVLTIFRERENIENFNKKALYIIIREMTDVKTLYITRVVNTLKKSYVELHEKYVKTGRLSLPKSSFLK